MQKGFTALYVVVILGSISLGLVLWLATGSMWALHSAVDGKDSNQAKVLTDACAEVALETMRENTSYTGSGNQTIGGNSCSYTVSSDGGDNRTVQVTGTVGTIVRKLLITTTAFNPLLVSSWQEVADF